jgi:hypothetical protein
MVRQRTSTVRAAALLSRALSLAMDDDKLTDEQRKILQQVREANLGAAFNNVLRERGIPLQVYRIEMAPGRGDEAAARRLLLLRRQRVLLLLVIRASARAGRWVHSTLGPRARSGGWPSRSYPRPGGR